MLIAFAFSNRIQAQQNGILTLTAGKTYNPSTWYRDTKTFDTPITVQIPETVTLTEGNSGDHSCILSITLDGMAQNTYIVVGYKGISRTHPVSNVGVFDNLQVAKSCFYTFNMCKGIRQLKPNEVIKVKKLIFEANGDSQDLDKRTYASIQLPIIVSSMVLNDLKVNQKLNVNEIMFADGTSLMTNPLNKEHYYNDIKIVDISTKCEILGDTYGFLNDKDFETSIFRSQIDITIPDEYLNENIVKVQLLKRDGTIVYNEYSDETGYCTKVMYSLDGIKYIDLYDEIDCASFGEVIINKKVKNIYFKVLEIDVAEVVIFAEKTTPVSKIQINDNLSVSDDLIVGNLLKVNEIKANTIDTLSLLSHTKVNGTLKTNFLETKYGLTTSSIKLNGIFEQNGKIIDFQSFETRLGEIDNQPNGIVETGLQFIGIGSGDYNKTVIYNDLNNGYKIDLARKTDNPSSEPINFNIAVRGSNSNLFSVDGKTGNVLVSGDALMNGTITTKSRMLDLSGASGYQNNAIIFRGWGAAHGGLYWRGDTKTFTFDTGENADLQNNYGNANLVVTGKVGIGTSATEYDLEIKSDNPSIKLHSTTGTGGQIIFESIDGQEGFVIGPNDQRGLSFYAGAGALSKFRHIYK